MKRGLIVFLLLLPVVNAVSFDEVVLLVQENVDGEAYVWPVQLSESDSVEEDGVRIPVDNPSWFVWVDNLPHTSFGHPVQYVFIADDGTARVLGGSFPATVNGVDIREGGVLVVKSSLPSRSLLEKVEDGVLSVLGKLRAMFVPTSMFYKEMPDVFCNSSVDSYAVLVQTVNDSDIDMEWEVDELYNILSRRIPQDQIFVVAPHRGLPPSTQSLVRVFDTLSKIVDCDDSVFVYVVGHGLNRYDVTMRKWDGSQLTRYYIDGKPFAATKLGVDYSDCYTPVGLDLRRGLCRDLSQHSVGIPDGYAIVNSTLNAWTLRFPEGRVDVSLFNSLFERLNTCDVVFVSSACYSGNAALAITKPGVRFFTASQGDEYSFVPYRGDAWKVGINGSFFGYAFISAFDNSDLNPQFAFEEAVSFVKRRVPEVLDKKHEGLSQNPLGVVPSKGSCSCACRGSS